MGRRREGRNDSPALLVREETARERERKRERARRGRGQKREQPGGLAQAGVAYIRGRKNEGVNSTHSRRDRER